MIEMRLEEFCIEEPETYVELTKVLEHNTETDSWDKTGD